MKIQLGNNMEIDDNEERFVYVNSNVSNVWLLTADGGSVVNDAFEVNQTFDSIIGFDQGTNVVVDVEMLFNGGVVQKMTFIGGLYEYF